MKRAMREVSACPHRRIRRTDSLHQRENRQYVCQLALQRVAGLIDDELATCMVTHGVCTACCQFPIPTAPNLNPVVASLVFSAAMAVSQKPRLTVRQQLLVEQIRDFSEMRLCCVDSALAPGRSGPVVERFESPVSPPLQQRTTNRKACVRFFGISPRIGLVGWNTRFGLGQVNRDIARQLKVVRWLAPVSQDSHLVDSPQPCQYAQANLAARDLRAWLTGLDAVVFVEQPPFENLTQIARDCRVPVVCIPNWEWIRPGLSWLAEVDLMLSPTRHTYELLNQWKRRFGFAWELDMVSWPIDLGQFSFRTRKNCRRFVFVGGRGGYRAMGVGKAADMVQRKGLALIVQAARLLPDCRFLVFTSEPLGKLPPNIEVRGFTERNAELYHEGDVCVQPSYWEGIGLPLLECQAAGLPLITTDAPPMNEYQPLASIPVSGEFIGSLGGDQHIPVPVIEPRELARVLSSVYGQPIRRASYRARQFVEREHSWSTARKHIRLAIDRLVRSYER